MYSMGYNMERYTPSGVAYMLACKKRELDKLHEQRVATAHRKQNEHPRYMQMTEGEFKAYIIDCIRFNLRKAKAIEEEIRHLESIKW